MVYCPKSIKIWNFTIVNFDIVLLLLHTAKVQMVKWLPKSVVTCIKNWYAIQFDVSCELKLVYSSFGVCLMLISSVNNCYMPSDKTMLKQYKRESVIISDNSPIYNWLQLLFFITVPKCWLKFFFHCLLFLSMFCYLHFSCSFYTAHKNYWHFQSQFVDIFSSLRLTITIF